MDDAMGILTSAGKNVPAAASRKACVFCALPRLQHQHNYKWPELRGQVSQMSGPTARGAIQAGFRRRRFIRASRCRWQTLAISISDSRRRGRP